MGSVWAGVHTTLGTRVAVKFIDIEHASSREARQRFENEARAAASLRSKHVVEVYDHGVTDDGRPFIVMEFLDGEPLDRRLDRVGRLHAKDAARIVGQVCRALQKAHAQGIVHRDLKPENVFLVWDDEDGADVAKVVDFGIAKFTDSMTASTSATRTGSVLGTPYYMSPEQARGLRSVDFRSDLWSVGVITFRCMTGHLPFEGEAVGDVLVKLCTAPLPVPSELVPDLPPGFDEWIKRALSREPEGRFRNAAELSTSLSNVCGLSVGSQSSDAFSGIVMPPMTARGGSFAATTPSPALATAHSHGTTGAPITQTPTPRPERPRVSTFIAVGLLAVTVLGIGVAVLTKKIGSAPAPEPASQSELKALPEAPVAAPGPTAAPTVALTVAPPAPAVEPTAPPATAAPAAPPSAATAAATTPAPRPGKRPPRTMAKPTQPKPGAPAQPAPKPGTDIGF